MLQLNEAKEKAFKTKWKITACNEGEKCWCRIIEPVETIEYYNFIGDYNVDSFSENFYIVPSACMDKQIAEYIVKLHNKNLEDGYI